MILIVMMIDIFVHLPWKYWSSFFFLYLFADLEVLKILNAFNQVSCWIIGTISHPSLYLTLFNAMKLLFLFIIVFVSVKALLGFTCLFFKNSDHYDT